MRFGYLLHNNNHADWDRHQTTDRSAPPTVADAHQVANDLRLMEIRGRLRVQHRVDL